MAGTIVGATIVNAKQLENKLISAFTQWVERDIHEDYWEEQFRDMDRWDYDGKTRRKNGALVESPRDIYDLGTLYESGMESFKGVDISATEASASWTWDAVGKGGYHYARDVHEGEGTNFGGRRGWTDELYFPQLFAESDVRLVLKGRIKAAFQGK